MNLGPPDIRSAAYDDKDVSDFDSSVLSMSVVGFHKKFG